MDKPADERSPPELTALELIAHLQGELSLASRLGGLLSPPAQGSAQLPATGPAAALAFDGDGTLWTGDVGEDVFHALLEQGGLKAEVLAPLQAFAARHGVEAETAGPAEQRALQLAHAVYRGYVAERVAERAICELMAWCFAGWTATSRQAFVSHVLSQRRLGERRIPESNQVLEWARSQGLRCVLISASPDAVVEVAGATYGFARADIQGIRTAMQGSVVDAAVEGPTTYAEGKASVGEALLGATPWLAAFGDSVFDAAMLRKARVGVGVRSKPCLLRELSAIPSGVRLARSPTPPSPERR